MAATLAVKRKAPTRISTYNIAGMKLSELKTGEKGVIVKVLGHGGFRKRIVEMGFIKGKVIEVLLNAPLHDPVNYRLMGYQVSLRHAEAEMIEIISMDEAKLLNMQASPLVASSSLSSTLSPDCKEIVDEQLRAMAMNKRRTINVALVGNPNCGKTSLFNFVSGAHEHVGNYSGVTVDAKDGYADYEGYHFHIVDLPGTYSLSAYSPEELYVRRQLIDNPPDVVINVLDASNIERNLYLTTQLVDMHLRMVCALNMYDEMRRRGDKLNEQKLGQLFGIPMIPTVFKSGENVDLLFHIIINLYEGMDFIDQEGNLNPEVAADLQDWHKNYERHHGGNHGEDFAHGSRPNNSVCRHVHLNHGREIERGIDAVKQELQNNEEIRHKYSTRYLSIKLLEMDKETYELVRQLPNSKRIFEVCNREVNRIKAETGEDSETAIMDAKYGLIHGALQEAGYVQGLKKDHYQLTHLIDSIITNRYAGFPILFLLLFVMFQCTFILGQYPMDGLSWLIERITDGISTLLPQGQLKDLLIDGVIGGVGAVIIFLPQILILYAFISFMEDSGYMARAAFIMDKLMHKLGLHGKSFIPLIMAFGCNVPAVIATRTIESRRSRLITMLILPMMSCSARLPVYLIITSLFFPLQYQGLILISLYLLGILSAIIMSNVFSRWLIRGDDMPFVMELPPYRFPTLRSIARHTWERGREYLRKLGGIILVASIIVWALGYFPHNEQLTTAAQQEQSYLGQMGKFIAPAFALQGFNWQLDVALVSGMGAKEIVASTLGVLYNNDVQQMLNDGVSPAVAFSFLVFVLLYFPCIATIVAIKEESGSWRWALFAALYTSVLAWVLSAVAYQLSSCFL